MYNDFDFKVFTQNSLKIVFLIFGQPLIWENAICLTQLTTVDCVVVYLITVNPKNVLS